MYFKYKSSDTKWVNASLCSGTSMDTLLYVFTDCSTTDKKAHGCVSVSDDYCSLQSQVEWEAQADQTYYIFVTGFGGSAGHFRLNFYEAVAPDHQFCSDAIPITFLPWVASGSTYLSEPSSTPCLGGTAGGLWWSIVGNGTSLKAHTCEYGTMDTIIQIYRGCSTCVTYNDDSCGIQSQAIWTADKGVTYYIFVSGYGGRRGDFVLNIGTVVSESHHTCNKAVEVNFLPFASHGSNRNVPASFSECSNTYRYTLWYVVHGTGQTLLASTCSVSNYVFDTVIEVYDACITEEATGCIAYNDDYCGVHSKVSFLTEIYNDYYIGVSGFRADVDGGNFTILIDIAENQPNDVCWSATKITALPYAVAQSTVESQNSVGGCGVSQTRAGRWYEIYMADASSPVTVEVTTCSNATDMPTFIEVYTSCSMQQCIAQSSGGDCAGKGSVEFIATPRQSYFVFITGGSSRGYIDIEFFEGVPNPNSYCESSYAIPQVPWTVSGDTVTSLRSYSVCSGDMRQGMWFDVIGTGYKMVAYTCSEYTDFDTYISIHNGCNNFSCIAYNDDADGVNCGITQSRVTWVSDLGALYRIFVTGYSTGIFQLSVIDEAPPVNDRCSKAIDLSFQPLPYATYGFTTFSVPSTGSCDEGLRRGVWYMISGAGKTFRAETCDYTTTFETIIELYAACNGDAGGEACVNEVVDDGFCGSSRQSLTFTLPASDQEVFYWLFVNGYDDATGMFKLRIHDLTPLPSEGDDGLSGGAIFGIIFAVFLGCGFIGASGGFVWWWYNKKYKHYAVIPDTTTTTTSSM